MLWSSFLMILNFMRVPDEKMEDPKARPGYPALRCRFRLFLSEITSVWTLEHLNWAHSSCSLSFSLIDGELSSAPSPFRSTTNPWVMLEFDSVDKELSCDKLSGFTGEFLFGELSWDKLSWFTGECLLAWIEFPVWSRFWGEFRGEFPFDWDEFRFDLFLWRGRRRSESCIVETWGRVVD